MKKILLPLVGGLFVVLCALVGIIIGNKAASLRPPSKVWYHVAVVEDGQVIFERVVAEVAIRNNDVRIDLKDGSFPTDTSHYTLITSGKLDVHYKEPVFPLFPSEKQREDDLWEVTSFGNMAVELRIDKTHIRDWATKK